MAVQRLPDPESDGFSFERAIPRTAGLTPRFLAIVVDFLVVLGLSMGLAYGLLSVGFHPDLGVGDPATSPVGLLWLSLVLELPVNLVYFTLLEGTTGTTFGKTLLELRVLRVDGSPVSLLDAFVRSLLRLLWVTPGLGQLFMVIDGVMVRRSEMEQRIGDKAADSVVARGPAGPKR